VWIERDDDDEPATNAPASAAEDGALPVAVDDELGNPDDDGRRSRASARDDQPNVSHRSRPTASRHGQPLQLSATVLGSGRVGRGWSQQFRVCL